MNKFTYKYARPSVTVTVFAFYDGKLLTGIRNDDADAYPSNRCIPGGFLNAKRNGFVGESANQAAIREFKEETNIDIFPQQLILFHEHSLANTDPRAHVVNLCYIVNLVDWQSGTAKAGDDLQSLEWLSSTEIYSPRDDWAFNHQDLAHRAVTVHQENYFKR